MRLVICILMLALYVACGPARIGTAPTYAASSGTRAPRIRAITAPAPCPETALQAPAVQPVGAPPPLPPSNLGGWPQDETGAPVGASYRTHHTQAPRPPPTS